MNIELLYNDAVALLKKLIATPSFSKEEDKTADIIQAFLKDHQVKSYIDFLIMFGQSAINSMLENLHCF